MTTLAALFAALPLMLGWGEGHELRRPLGLAIFGGLIVSQLLTLFTTPVIYLAFDRLGRRFSRKRARRVMPCRAGAGVVRRGLARGIGAAGPLLRSMSPEPGRCPGSPPNTCAPQGAHHPDPESGVRGRIVVRRGAGRGWWGAGCAQVLGGEPRRSRGSGDMERSRPPAALVPCDAIDGRAT